MSFSDLQAKHLPPCTYCGEPATTRDHVPPRAFKPFNTFTVPCCRRCNQEILRDLSLHTVDVRREYVQNELRRLQGVPAAKRLGVPSRETLARRSRQSAVKRDRLGGTLDLAALKALRGGK